MTHAATPPVAGLLLVEVDKEDSSPVHRFVAVTFTDDDPTRL